MFKGFYTATTGMLSQQRKSDMLTNNMANANTPGFKADQASLRAFPEMLLQQLQSNGVPGKDKSQWTGKKEVGLLNTGVYVQEVTPNFAQGDVRETGRRTDVALINRIVPVNEEGVKGTFFFTVRDENNSIRYTRNGNFTLDGQGFLTTNEGLYVMDRNNQPIQLQGTDFQINSQGTVMENGQSVAQLNIAMTENANSMMKEGNGLYRTDNELPLPSAFGNPAVSFDIQQGSLERSNVDVTQTMTELLSAYRAFEANQKIVQAYDRSMEKAANEIGRLR
ncbi:flagellar hook-basal body protein [Bacillus songklensis]|uniref:Flagellar hook-basal body protein n=1 Tax=Bacillus songklensis TaxID=1069116 RepID=A0ABV8B9I6_9BACI